MVAERPEADGTLRSLKAVVRRRYRSGAGVAM